MPRRICGDIFDRVRGCRFLHVPDSRRPGWTRRTSALHFRFGFKVTDAITVHRYPNLPKHGPMAGKVNPHFLNADLFRQSFLAPMKTIRPNAGPIIFEFSHFHPGEFERGRDFIAALDGFLTQIPRDWQYAVEVRNKTFLHPEYFAMLRGHGVAHCFNHGNGCRR